MNYTPGLPSRNHNVTPASPLRELFTLLCGLLALVTMVYIVLGVSVELLVNHISPTTEQKISSFFLNNYTFTGDNDPETRYLQHLVDQMLAKRCVTLPYPIKVHLVDSETINAMAVPGGHIIVFSGLIDMVQSENELSFVLGHELGHFFHKDHLRGLGRSLVFLTMATVLHAPGKGVSNLVGRAVRVTESGFSRNQESAADTVGLRILQCTYGHVNGATDFFVHMPTSQDPGQLGHYFASHPDNRQRVNDILQLIQKNEFHKEALTSLAMPEH